jgi:hypothetical protein
VAVQREGKEAHEVNTDVFVLNLRTNVWRREAR